MQVSKEVRAFLSAIGSIKSEAKASASRENAKRAGAKLKHVHDFVNGKKCSVCGKYKSQFGGRYK